MNRTEDLRRAAEVLAGAPPKGAQAPRYVGVDLGTATVVLLALDEAGQPLAGRLVPARVVRDGLVVDFIGAADLLRRLKAEVEAELGHELTEAAAGYPPGVPQAEVRATAHVVEAAGMHCLGLVDEPTAANHVLGLERAALVDVGGGTTGIAIVEAGQVVHTADEPTGGLHFDLVIAGALDLPVEAAEAMKRDPEQQPRLLPLVRPVIEKVAAIVARTLERHPVPEVVLVGGTSAFQGMETVMAEWLGLPVRQAPEPQLVTPLGIALAHRTLAQAAEPMPTGATP